MKNHHKSPKARNRRHTARRSSKPSASLRPLGLRIEPLEQRTLLDAAGLFAPDAPQDEGLFGPAEVVAKAVAPVAGDLVVSEINYHPHDLSQVEIDADFDPPPEYTGEGDPPDDWPTTGDEEQFEYIELLNRSDHEIELNGVTLHVHETSPGLDPDPEINITLGAKTLGIGERVVVVRDQADFLVRYDTVDANIVAGEYLAGVLPNSGGTVELKNNVGTLLQRFAYNDQAPWPSRADGSGSTMDKEYPFIREIIDDLGTVDDDENDWNSDAGWDDSFEYNGTPGAVGEAEAYIGNKVEVVINEVLTHTDWPESDAIELYNTTNQAIDVGGWFLTDSNANADRLRKFQIPELTIIRAGGYVVFDEYDFNPEWDNVDPDARADNHFALSSSRGDNLWLMKGDPATGKLTHFTDHVDFGGALNGESFGRTQPNSEGDIYFYPMLHTTLDEQNSEPRVGPVIISEIMYDLPGSDKDVWYAEYVEIYNPTNQTIDLTDWRIRQAFRFDFADGETIGPGEVKIVVPFGEAQRDSAGWLYADRFTSFHEVPPFVKDFFVYDAEVDADTPVAGDDPANNLDDRNYWWGSALSGDGEKIRLEAPDEATMIDGESYTPRIVMDEVRYNNNDFWPEEAAGEGGSLYRLGLQLFGSEGGNWGGDDISPSMVDLFPPFAVDDPYLNRWAVGAPDEVTPIVTQVDQAVQINVLANDSSQQPLDFSSVSTASANAVPDTVTGVITYTPDPGFHGIDTFTYTVKNTTFNMVSNAATVEVVVTDPPEAVADPDYSTTINTPINIDVLANDLNDDGEPLWIELTNWSSGAPVIDKGTTETDPRDDTVTFTPQADYTGSASDSAWFEYQVTDGYFTSSPARVTIEVLPDNSSPVLDSPIEDVNAQEDDGDWSHDLTTVFSDPDDDTLTFTVESSDESLVNAYISGDELVLDYFDNQHGSAIITVRAADAQFTVEDQFTVTVDAVNDFPRLIGSLDPVEVDEDPIPNPQTISLAGLFDDYDIATDGDVLTLTAGSDNGALVGASVNGETLTLAFEGNQYGSATITVFAADLAGAEAETTFEVTVDSVNDPPVAFDARGEETLEETLLQIPVAQLVTDIEGDLLTISVVGLVPNGTAVLNNHGTPDDQSDDTFDIMPADDYNGPIEFTYKANDGELDSNEATIRVIVREVNDPPIARDDTDEVAEDNSITIDVLANDDVGSPNEELEQSLELIGAEIETVGEVGSVSIVENKLLFEPAADYNGPVRIRYTIKDIGDGISSEQAEAYVDITVTEVNDEPLPAGDLELFVDEDESGTINVLAGATTGPSNEDQLLELLSEPLVEHGKIVSWDPDGTVVYQPDANYFGDDTITFTIHDNGTTNGQLDPKTAIGTVAVTVAPINDRPVAIDDEIGVDEGGSVQIPLLDNDEDDDGDTLSVVMVDGPSHGVFDPDTRIYTPDDPNFFGIDTFTYRASDGLLESLDTAEVTITVRSVNDLPYRIKEFEPVVVNEDDLPWTIDLTEYFGDVDVASGEDSLSYSVGTNSNANVVVATIVEDGSTLTLTFAAEQSGQASIVIRATDSTGESIESTLSVTVNPVNDAPVAVLDEYSVAEGGTLSYLAPGVLLNDTDIDSGQLTAELVEGPDGIHAFELLPDGGFTFTPESNFNGDATFTYRAYDGEAYSEPVVVTIDVSGVNDPPTTQSDEYSLAEDQTLEVPAVDGVLANDSDIEGNPLVVDVAVTVDPTHGQLAINPDGSFTYTPDANFAGADEFKYQAYDGQDNSVETTVTITVTEVNDPPETTDDTATATEDTLLENINVLGNDAPGPEGFETDQVLTVSDPVAEHGEVIVNPDGTLNYMPDANFSGDDVITYTLTDDGTTDGQADPQSATGQVIVTVTPVNDAPVGEADEYHTDEDTLLDISAPGVLGNDTDVDSGSLSATLVDLPDNGELTFNADGSFTYMPDTDFAGTDTFTYRATDNDLDSEVTTVTIIVDPVNDPPVAENDAHETDEDVPLEVPVENGVVTNDTDIDSAAILAVLVDGPSHGEVTLNEDGSFVYTPEADYFGTDTFTYKAFDGEDESVETAQVTITVNPINDAPEAVNDEYTVEEDSTLDVTAPGLLTNDDDVEDDDLSATLVDGPDHGSLDLQADGSFIYTPEADYVGPDSFTYKVDDGELESDVATVSITVDPANDPPTAENDSYDVDEDAVLNVDAPGVLDNDEDIDGDTLSAVLVEGPEHGELTLNEDGSFSYTPEPNFNGTDSFTYRAADELTESAEATVTITVNPVNDAPTADDDAYLAETNESLTIEIPGVLEGDEDIDEDSLTAVLVDLPEHGELVFNDDGSFTYTPDADFNGLDSFTYRAADGQDESELATVNLTVAQALGEVDFLIVETQNPTTGELWYRGQSVREGILSIEALFDGQPEDVSLTLFASNLDELATSEPVNGILRIDHDVEAGQTFLLRVSGVNEDVDLRLANLVQQDGQTVTVHGTAGDDSLQFETIVDRPLMVGATVRWLQINGVEYEFSTPVVASPPLFSLTYYGGEGSDTAVVTGSDDDENVTVYPDRAIVSGANHYIELRDVADTTIYAAGGYNLTTFYDSPGDDEFVGFPNGGLMIGQEFRSIVVDSDEVTAFASAGGQDSVRLYDSWGDDVFVSTSNYGGLLGPGYAVHTQGFKTVHAFATLGGYDTAMLYDSRGDDNFYANPVEATFYGNGFYRRGKLFEEVHAYSTSGGSDVAKFFGSEGDDEFYASAIEAGMSGEGYFNRVKHFETIEANAGQGGYDTAELFDSPGNDLFVATPTYGGMSGPGFQNHAMQFDSVDALSDAGGHDVAKMYDSPGDDLFVANATEATISINGLYSNRAEGFEGVHAYATAGGRDRAELDGTDGDDTFVCADDAAAVFGDGFYNRAKFFEEVYGNAGTGGYDEVYLRESPQADLLEAQGNWIRMSAVLDYLYEAVGFDYAKATTDSDEDSKNITYPLDFTLDLEGPW